MTSMVVKFFLICVNAIKKILFIPDCTGSSDHRLGKNSNIYLAISLVFLVDALGYTAIQQKQHHSKQHSKL